MCYCDCDCRKVPTPDLMPLRDLSDCTCPTTWMAVIPPPPCPVHGRAQMLRVVC